MIDIVNLAICGISESVSLFRNKQDVLQFFFSFPQLSCPFPHLLIALQWLDKHVTSTSNQAYNLLSLTDQGVGVEGMGWMYDFWAR